MGPGLGGKVFDRRSVQKSRMAKNEISRLENKFYLKTFKDNPAKWLDGTVTEQTSSVYHKVLVGDQLWKRHVDQKYIKLTTPTSR